MRFFHYGNDVPGLLLCLFPDKHLDVIGNICTLFPSCTGIKMQRVYIFFCCMFVCAANADDFSAIGAPICGYGKYRQNAKCYTYDDVNDSICQGRSVSGAACLNVFVNTSSDIDGLYPFDAGFSVFGYATNFESSVNEACGGNGVIGTSCLDQFMDTAAQIDGWYPFTAGFSAMGASVSAYSNMRNNDCLGTMDGYYSVEMTKFAKLTNYQCSGTMSKYEILNDCQNIDMTISDASDTRSPLHPDNYMCGVLCDAGLVYTATGTCSSYCVLNDDTQQLHIMYDDKHVEIPLYTDALTTPAIHLQMSDDMVCHVNLSTKITPDTIRVKYKDKIYYGTK